MESERVLDLKTFPGRPDSGETEAYAARKAGREGNSGDGAERRPERTGYLAQRRARIWRYARCRTHHTGMSAMSPAANGQEFLRRGESEHRCRWQHCAQNEQ